MIAKAGHGFLDTYHMDLLLSNTWRPKILRYLRGSLRECNLYPGDYFLA